jgi:hypothetical protein
VPLSDRLDRTSLVAGVGVTLAATLLLLDRTGTLDLGFGYGLPLLVGLVGAILLPAGLAGPRRTD